MSQLYAMSMYSPDVSFDKTREHLAALLQVKLSKETIRRACHRHGRRLAEWQLREESTPQAFAAAKGEVEFTVDAGKANTLEEGWKDLKIAAFHKRPPAAPATPAEWNRRRLPEPTARVAWATIAPSKRFRKTWRRWSRRRNGRRSRRSSGLANCADRFDAFDRSEAGYGRISRRDEFHHYRP